MGVFGPITQALYPFVCRHVARTEQADADESVRVVFFRAIALLGLILSIAMYYCAPLGIYFLGGHVFDQAIDILRIMAPVPFLVALASLLGAQTLVPHGYEKQFSQVIAAAGPLGIALVSLGTTMAGLKGAAFAYLIVEIAVTTAFALLVHSKVGLAQTFGWKRHDSSLRKPTTTLQPPVPRPTNI